MVSGHKAQTQFKFIRLLIILSSSEVILVFTIQFCTHDGMVSLNRPHNISILSRHITDASSNNSIATSVLHNGTAS